MENCFAMSYLGYLIEPCQNSQCLLRDKIHTILDHSRGHPIIHEYFENKNDFSDFHRVYNFNLMDEIARSINSVDIRRYISYLENNPGFPDHHVYYDHGIYGSFIFLGLMHTIFRHQPTIIPNGSSKIIYDSRLLQRSLRRVATSIALHNLDGHPDALRNSRLYDKRLYILNGNSPYSATDKVLYETSFTICP